MPEPDARAIAKLFRSRFHRGYAKGKLRTDPLYGAVFERLETAFVRRQLFLVLPPPAENQAERQQNDAEPQGNPQKHENR